MNIWHAIQNEPSNVCYDCHDERCKLYEIPDGEGYVVELCAGCKEEREIKDYEKEKPSEFAA